GFRAAGFQDRPDPIAETRLPPRSVPREATAIGWVDPALHADLVAVVDARGTRQRRLEQRREPDAGGVAEDGPHPRRVMRAEQVELDRDDVWVVSARKPFDAPLEFRGVVRIDHVGVLRLLPDEVQVQEG